MSRFQPHEVLRGSTFAVPRPPVFYYLTIAKYSRKALMILLKTANTAKVLLSESFPRLQYSIKSKQTRCIKNLNLRKEVGIAIKSKETSSQFESVRNCYVAIMHQPVANNHVVKCMYK